jgi:sporulation-control protein
MNPVGTPRPSGSFAGFVSWWAWTRVEVETGDGQYDATQEFHRQRATGAFRLAAGQRHDIPFCFEVPWETPITEVYGA